MLFLDRISSQWAHRNRRLAKALNIQLRWLPKACPELSPVDRLWRHLKKDVLANEPLPSLQAALEGAWSYLRDLSRNKRFRKAGVLLGYFWSQNVFPVKR